MDGPDESSGFGCSHNYQRAEAFSNASGEKLGEIDQSAQAAMNKFKGDNYAEQTLSRAREKPDSLGRQEALKKVLADKVKEVSEVGGKVSKLVGDIQKNKISISTRFIQK